MQKVLTASVAVLMFSVAGCMSTISLQYSPAQRQVTWEGTKPKIFVADVRDESNGVKAGSERDPLNVTAKLTRSVEEAFKDALTNQLSNLGILSPSPAEADAKLFVRLNEFGAYWGAGISVPIQSTIRFKVMLKGMDNHPMASEDLVAHGQGIAALGGVPGDGLSVALNDALADAMNKVGQLFIDGDLLAPILSMPHASGTTYTIPLQSDVDSPKYQNAENPNNFAVVIGVEKYGSLPSAQFAQRDAEAVRANLIALGYPMRNIFFLSDQDATRAKIAQSVNTWLPNRISEKSTVFFYYSGHGAPDPKTNQTYLVGMDGTPEDLESTAYPLKTLYVKLGGLKARQVIVALDSCFSGAGGRSVLPKGTRPLLSKIDMGIVPEKLIVLTASDKDQISGTLDEQGHGTFTYYLLKGLDGAARDSSGFVTVSSLYNYMLPKVQDAARLHNRDQTPQLLPENSERAEIKLR